MGIKQSRPVHKCEPGSVQGRTCFQSAESKSDLGTSLLAGRVFSGNRYLSAEGVNTLTQTVGYLSG